LVMSLKECLHYRIEKNAECVISNEGVSKQSQDEIPRFFQKNKITKVLLKHNTRLIASLVVFLLLFGSSLSTGFSAEFPFFVAEKQPSGGHQSHEKTVAPSILPDGARISEKVFGLIGLSNVGRVSPCIFRGAHPLPEGYETLKEMGIKTVINLRSQHSEKDIVEAAGMQSIEIPMSVFRSTEIEKVNKIIDSMTNPDNQPVYLHCQLGQDRTGVVIAAYRMRVDGWSLSETEAEMQSFGFNDLWLELNKIVREYAESVGEGSEKR
jgi:tyrosine-protein phosphatase SIW14